MKRKKKKVEIFKIAKKEEENRKQK